VGPARQPDAIGYRESTSISFASFCGTPPAADSHSAAAGGVLIGATTDCPAARGHRKCDKDRPGGLTYCREAIAGVPLRAGGLAVHGRHGLRRLDEDRSCATLPSTSKCHRLMVSSQGIMSIRPSTVAGPDTLSGSGAPLILMRDADAQRDDPATPATGDAEKPT